MCFHCGWSSRSLRWPPDGRGPHLGLRSCGRAHRSQDVSLGPSDDQSEPDQNPSYGLPPAGQLIPSRARSSFRKLICERARVQRRAPGTRLSQESQIGPRNNDSPLRCVSGPPRHLRCPSSQQQPERPTRRRFSALCRYPSSKTLSRKIDASPASRQRCFPTPDNSSASTSVLRCASVRPAMCPRAQHA